MVQWACSPLCRQLSEGCSRSCCGSSSCFYLNPRAASLKRCHEQKRNKLLQAAFLGNCHHHVEFIAWRAAKKVAPVELPSGALSSRMQERQRSCLAICCFGVDPDPIQWLRRMRAAMAASPGSEGVFTIVPCCKVCKLARCDSLSGAGFAREGRSLSLGRDEPLSECTWLPGRSGAWIPSEDVWALDFGWPKKIYHTKRSHNVCVCVHMYESMFVHMCMYICACVCMHVCMYVCNCVSMYVLGRRAPFRTHCYTSSAPNSSCPQYRCHQPSIHCANLVQPTRVVIYEILVVERVLLDFIAVQRTVLNTNLAGKMHVPE